MNGEVADWHAAALAFGGGLGQGNALGGRFRGGAASDSESDAESEHNGAGGPIRHEEGPQQLQWPFPGPGHDHVPPAAVEHPPVQNEHDYNLAGDRMPKAGTGAWFRMHRTQPICPGHSVSIAEACHWLATLKSSSRMTDEAVDKVCMMVSKFLLPSGNFFPSSYHMVRTTLGVDDSRLYTDHICDKCWSVFPRLPAAELSAHANDVCQASGHPGCLHGTCGNPRFEQSETGNVLPRRSIYQFGVGETVRDLLETALENWEQVKTQRAADFGQPETFWGSPAGKQLDAACGNLFSNPPYGEIAVIFALGAVPTKQYII